MIAVLNSEEKSKMIKYELVKVTPDLFDYEANQNVFYTLDIPEINQKYEILGVPGFNMFTFQRKNSNQIPKDLDGMFTEHRLIVQAIETFLRNYKAPIVPKAPKPQGVTISQAKAD